MVRRKSTAEDVIDVIAKFPWWVGGSLAVVSFFVLHHYAQKGLPGSSGQDLNQAVRSGTLYTFALLGQYILPGVCAIGALVSLLGRRKRRHLYDDVSQDKAQLPDLSWQDFELLVGEYYRRQGYKVSETGPGADGGVDLVLQKDREKILVQCKHWKAYKVGVKPVRELLGVMAGSSASGGVVVTSGNFTQDAKRFADENSIRIVNGEELKRIIDTPKPKKDSFTAQKNDSAAGEDAQICPKCGGQLVKRIARKGDRAGQEFLGCSTFPKCKFTKSM